MSVIKCMALEGQLRNEISLSLEVPFSDGLHEKYFLPTWIA